LIDTNKEDIAIKEAQRLNIPVAAVVDTSCRLRSGGHHLHRPRQ
jgi:ribosomal protein S2